MENFRRYQNPIKKAQKMAFSNALTLFSCIITGRNLVKTHLCVASSPSHTSGSDSRPTVFKIDAFGHAVDFLQQYDFSWFSDLTTIADGSILVWYVFNIF